MTSNTFIPWVAALTLAFAGMVQAGQPAATQVNTRAADTTLLPASRGDLIPQSLQQMPARTAAVTPGNKAAGHATQPKTPTAPAIDHRPVHVSWKLDGKRKLAAAPKPFQQKSRGYWQDVSADALKRGLELPVTSSGALIRLSPEGGAFGKLDPRHMHVSHGAKTFSAAQASSHMANTSQLRQAGMPASNGSMIMKLKPGLGTGPVTLRADDAKGRYVVHVYEPHSPLVLHAQTTRDTIASGQSVRLNVQLTDAASNRAMDAVGGFVVTPDGHTRSIKFRRNANGSYHADITPDASHADRRGLWELHTFTSAIDASGHTVLRDATTAFSVSVTDARLDGSVRIAGAGFGSARGPQPARNIDINLGIEAASASRYAVSGVLYGHAADGRLEPIGYAQSANWLRPGHGTIDLRFDAGALAGSRLQPPYELHDLKLMDQARMGLLERRAVALRFSP